MARYPGYGDVTYAFGPGGLTPAIKYLIIANVVAFLATLVMPVLRLHFGLSPSSVYGQFTIYQLVTYMFLHGDVGHILFNMLALWMFGTDLERRWGTRFFTKYYFVTGIGAGVVTVLWALAGLPFADRLAYSLVIGASGAIYGVLLAYGMYFPHRVILLFLLFPVPAKYAVMIFGAIAFIFSFGAGGGGVAHTAHLGGLVVGYVYLTTLRGGGPLQELKYRWLRWKMARARNKFDVYTGGRNQRPGDDDWKSEWKKHIH
jgi:membrane associated rhomboid family serine protease